MWSSNFSKHSRKCLEFAQYQALKAKRAKQLGKAVEESPKTAPSRVQTSDWPKVSLDHPDLVDFKEHKAGKDSDVQASCVRVAKLLWILGEALDFDSSASIMEAQDNLLTDIDHLKTLPGLLRSKQILQPQNWLQALASYVSHLKEKRGGAKDVNFNLMHRLTNAITCIKRLASQAGKTAREGVMARNSREALEESNNWVGFDEAVEFVRDNLKRFLSDRAVENYTDVPETIPRTHFKKIRILIEMCTSLECSAFRGE